MWSLCPEVFDGVEDIDNAFCLHPLYGCTQGTESTSSTYSSTEGDGEGERVVREMEKQVFQGRERGGRNGERGEGQREGKGERERRARKGEEEIERSCKYSIPAVDYDRFVSSVLLCAYDLVNEVNHSSS